MTKEHSDLQRFHRTLTMRALDRGLFVDIALEATDLAVANKPMPPWCRGIALWICLGLDRGFWRVTKITDESSFMVIHQAMSPLLKPIGYVLTLARLQMGF